MWLPKYIPQKRAATGRGIHSINVYQNNGLPTVSWKQSNIGKASWKPTDFWWGQALSERVMGWKTTAELVQPQLCLQGRKMSKKSFRASDSNLKMFLTHFLQRLALPKATSRSKTNLELIFQHGVWCQHQLWQKELRNLMPITPAFQLEDPSSNSPPHRRKKATETALSNRASFFEPCHYNINIASALIY